MKIFQKLLKQDLSNHDVPFDKMISLWVKIYEKISKRKEEL